MIENNLLKKKDKDLLIFSEALEYYDNMDSIESEDCEQLEEDSSIKNVLRKQMLEELDLLKQIIGNHPDFKFESLSVEEKKFFQEFVVFYAVCPICKQKNHSHNIKKLFFNENKQLIDDLIRIMTYNNKKLKKLNLNFGIPCCNCFKKYFE
jgi:hypothetical protein